MALSDYDYECMATAMHECGHDLGQEAGGLPPALCIKAGHTTGETQADLPRFPTDEQFKGYLISLVTGQEAEAQYLRICRGYSIEEARRATRSGAVSDLAKFEKYRQYISGSLTEEQARERSEEIVITNFRYLTVMASRLLRARTMRTRDITAAYEARDTADLYMML